MENVKISKNFSLNEFNSVMPERDLLQILQELRDETQESVIIDEDCTRTVRRHIEIYKNLYGDDWLNHIHWGSRHLPAFGKGLRAVDLRAKKGEGLWRGHQLGEIVKKIAKRHGIKIGLGVGALFIHLDVDRKRDAEWKYNY